MYTSVLKCIVDIYKKVGKSIKIQVGGFFANKHSALEHHLGSVIIMVLL